MKKEVISQLHSSFELAVNETDGIEYWFARDLQELLGYTKWENFIKVIDKGKIACSNGKQETSDHFLEVRKMVDLGSGAKRATAKGMGAIAGKRKTKFVRERIIGAYFSERN